MSDIDVIIPTRDRASLVSRAIESVLEQTLRPNSVTVVDDGSVDDTSDVLKRFGDAIRIVSTPGLGVSAARNAGIRQTTSSWIAFLDSDDLWEPYKLERQWTALNNESYRYRWSHTDEIWIRNGRRVNPMKKHQKPEGWVFEASLKLCCVSPSSVLVERTFLTELGGFDEELPACEDYALWLKMAAREPVHFIEDKLTIKFGGHDDQLSRRFWGMDRFRAQALESLLSESGLSTELRVLALENLVFRYDVLLTGAKKRGGSEFTETWESSRHQAMKALEVLR